MWIFTLRIINGGNHHIINHYKRTPFNGKMQELEVIKRSSLVNLV